MFEMKKDDENEPLSPKSITETRKRTVLNNYTEPTKVLPVIV